MLFSWRSDQARFAKSEIRSLARALEIGMTRDEFEHVFENGSFVMLSMQLSSNDNLLIRTPLQWGAANWVMWVTFSDNKITSIRIRTQDSMNEKPRGAPDDKPEG